MLGPAGGGRLGTHPERPARDGDHPGRSGEAQRGQSPGARHRSAAQRAAEGVREEGGEVHQGARDGGEVKVGEGNGGGS